MKYPKYPEYKDSGVEWIGEIPKEWNAVKLGIFARANSGKRPPLIETDGRIPIYGANGVIGYTNFSMNNELKLLVGRVGSSGAVNIAYPPCWISDNVLIISHNSNVLNFQFLYHLLGLFDYSIEKSNTAQPLITSSALLAKKIPIPPIEDQAKIENFLDGVSKKIGKLIKDIMKNVELLKEKRQAIITKAVTKGLDRNVPMKDSGVEWAGEIPEHWNIQKLKRIFQVLNGSTPRSDNPLYWNGNIIWVTPEDLSLTVSSVICKSSRQITAEGYDSCGTNLVPKGSIIVSTRAPIGYVKITGVEICTNQGCRSLVKKTETNEKYFFYYLSCFGSVLNSLGQGSTFAELSSENLKMFQALIPPIGEQITITQFLAYETSKIDGLISKHLKLIDLLKEYKTSLITQAVTGKIDVRGFPASSTSNNV
jgi:type I restriction enzyme S subunit